MQAARTLKKVALSSIAVLLIALTASLTWWLWPQPLSLPGYSHSEEQERETQTARAACGPPRIEGAASSRKGSRERIACEKEEREKYHETADLIQQTRAADAGAAQASIGWQSARMLALQTAAGFLTLIAAIAAAYFARQASIAAQKTVDATWKIGKPQTEADLVVRIATSLLTRPTAQVTFRIRNLGASTAKNVKFEGVSSFFAGDSLIGSSAIHAPYSLDNEVMANTPDSAAHYVTANWDFDLLSRMATVISDSAQAGRWEVTCKLQYSTAFNDHVTKTYEFGGDYPRAATADHIDAGLAFIRMKVETAQAQGDQ